METKKEIWFCQKCLDEQKGAFIHGYRISDSEICSIHNVPMEETNISLDEYRTIVSISHDTSFCKAMIKLKQDDIIEYEMRMSRLNSEGRLKKHSKKQISLIALIAKAQI